MISLYGYTVFLLTLAVAAAVPGPGVATVIARTLSHGIKAGLLVTLGTIAGDIIWLSVAILGLAAIAKTFAVVFLAIKYVGAAYLAYLAWKLWNAPAGQIDMKDTSNRKASGFWVGLSVALSNPKTIMFYLAILPTLIDIGHVGFKLYGILTATIFFTLFVVMGSYVLLAAGIKQAFKQSSAVRIFQRSTSMIMAGAAAMIVAR
ncbi:LysE family translocator [Microvirga sp. W0021]|uniref:LysE family translocator n=1 Tax=Hohaiivirga grylli TaxID=3133970 RepID=A0ABV0BFD7_9HYPH